MPELTATVYELRFPGHPASVNQLLGHWSKAHALKVRDRLLVKIAAGNADVPKATTKRRVSVTLVMGPKNRRRDPDASWKSLLDAMVSCGLLVNDSAEWVELTPITVMRGPAAETVVRMEDR